MFNSKLDSFIFGKPKFLFLISLSIYFTFISFFLALFLQTIMPSSSFFDFFCLSVQEEKGIIVTGKIAEIAAHLVITTHGGMEMYALMQYTL